MRFHDLFYQFFSYTNVPVVILDSTFIVKIGYIPETEERYILLVEPQTLIHCLKVCG